MPEGYASLKQGQSNFVSMHGILASWIAPCAAAKIIAWFLTKFAGSHAGSLIAALEIAN